MNDYAVIKTGGKQYQVKPGDIIDVEKVEGKDGDKITFDQVLLIKLKGKLKIGQPLLKGVSVVGTIKKQFKGKKVRVAKFRAKSRYRKVQGHRQQLTQVEILSF